MPCGVARHVRLELDISSSSGSIFFKLYEITLLKTIQTACASAGGCRHGGICESAARGGRCTCPLSLGCTHAGCGWAGDTCERPACQSGHYGPAISCNSQLTPTRGRCGGPNTCTCQPGFHNTVGISQCLDTQCGDGATTAVSGEQCDDGNTRDGDGCDASCQLESNPDVQRVLSSVATDRKLPQKDVQGGEVTRETLAATLGVSTEQIQSFRVSGSGPQAEVIYEFVPYVFTTTGCGCHNGGDCVTKNFRKACECSVGFSGAQCETSLCSRACDHGGTCAGKDVCIGCAEGWSGDFCGTMTHSYASVTVVGACVCASVLFVAIIVVLCKLSWVPIQARGGFDLIASLLGGTIWVLSAIVPLRGELVGFDANQPSLWQLYLPLVCGFGLWLGANLIYIRAMVMVHINVTVPLHSLLLLPLALVPWVLASAFRSMLVTMLTCLLAIFYCVSATAVFVETIYICLV
jgi:cysteine-rich repeat protein